MIPLERAAELTLPTLVISGTKDLIWPPAVFDALLPHLPNATLVSIDSGHSPYFENAPAFNRAVRGFLATI